MTKALIISALAVTALLFPTTGAEACQRALPECRAGLHGMPGGGVINQNTDHPAAEVLSVHRAIDGANYHVVTPIHSGNGAVIVSQPPIIVSQPPVIIMNGGYGHPGGYYGQPGYPYGHPGYRPQRGYVNGMPRDMYLGQVSGHALGAVLGCILGKC